MRGYSSNGIGSVFFYTREAHPGEYFPAHQSMDQKVSHARAFVDQVRTDRLVVVDDLAGTGHRAYGELPNMTYLINRAGRVVFRSDWTDIPTIQAMLDYVVGVRDHRREGRNMKPFYAEFIGYRWTDDAAFLAGLEIAGPQAVSDFNRKMEEWSKQHSPAGVRID